MSLLRNWNSFEAKFKGTCPTVSPSLKENFLAQLQQQESSDGDEEDEFLNEQAQPEEPSIKTFKGAILSLEEV